MIALSQRETRVAAMVCEGMKNAEIAEVIGVTKVAVKNNVVSIMNKTGMGSRLELALWWLERNHVCDK